MSVYSLTELKDIMIIDRLSDVLKNKISLLVQLANVDGHFDTEERSFIYNVCIRKGVPLAVIGEIIDEVEPFDFPHNISHATAVDYLSECLLLMMVDGKVLPSEVRFCLEIGEELGFNKRLIEKLIKDLQELNHVTYKEVTKHVARIRFSNTY